MSVQSDLSTAATRGAEESGCCKEVVVSGGSTALPSYLVGPEGCGTDMVSGIPSQRAACKKT